MNDPEDEESLNGEEDNINFDSFGQLSSQATNGLHLRCFAYSLQLVIKKSLKRILVASYYKGSIKGIDLMDDCTN
ncbi:hypothetical protein BpHYR1_011866 [Brachionus plicatilis]|uniref:Uncharacterized protein n=1 Tax=Brachionus plicatilis TaxID=10195 RepID=A0A3M7SYD3_BRAPC|nr:hypothetical protein BpHYR1_011866 [Brachionus plicatilis]